MFSPSDAPDPTTAPGFALARGVCRFLLDQGFAPVTEFIPARGLRADVTALGPKGEIWVIECKSSRADFQTDRKWRGYLEWCDAFFFAAPTDFPLEILPENEGLILADAYNAEIIRDPVERKLTAARRKAQTLKLARAAAARLRRAEDPRARALDDMGD